MSKFNAGVDGARFAEAIMIKTSIDGHNGGRTYYIQADSKNDCEQLESTISRLAKIAARRAKSTSSFAKLRLLARDIFESSSLQGASAFLILAVRWPILALIIG